MTGTWERNVTTRIAGELTPYGESLREGLTIFDDPEYYCRNYNVYRSTNTTNSPVKIEETAEKIVIYFEGNAAERHLFKDGKTPSENVRIEGTSVATVQRDGTLEIRTEGFPDKLVHGVRDGGITTSDQMRYLERYRISEDGQTIDVMQVLHDPQVLEYPQIVLGTWNRIADDGYWFANPCVIHEDEIIYTDELRERGLEMLQQEGSE